MRSILRGATALLAAGLLTTSAQAADLGGNCCADLEERIAELESTVAKKGNRKMSLTAYGQVSKSLLVWDLDGVADGEDVIDNSAEETFVGFAGQARVRDGFFIGYTLEVGLGGRDAYSALTFETDNVFVRRSFVYLKSDTLGTVSWGKQDQATQDLDKLSTARTGVAVRPLSLRPVTGEGFSSALDLWDGNRGPVIRYDSPSVLGGFVLSASWATNSLSSDEIWDVALRFAGEYGQFKVVAGAGYRSGIIVDLEPLGTIGLGDQPEVWTLVGSVMHVPSGVFLTVNYGDLSFDGAVLGVPGFTADATAWALTGGIEQKWTALGKTTLFAEVAETGEDLDGISYWGAGVVQGIDKAAMELYGNFRQYEFGDQDATVGTLGARVRF